MPIKHSLLTAIHKPYAAVYADSATRLAATGFTRGEGGGTVVFDSTDLYKKVLQLDDASEWILIATTPTWMQVTGAGALANDSITNALLANMAQATIKGRAAGAGTGDPTDLTATQATAILNAVVGDSGAGGTKGLVPAPGAGDAAAGKYLDAAGLFSVPPGTGLTTEQVQDVVGAMVVAGTNVTVTYNDPAGTLTIDAAGDGGGTNPTSLFVPYNNAGTFADSRIKRENTNITSVIGPVNTPQTLKVYSSDDGSGNSRWMQFGWNGSDTHEILATASGSGGVSNLRFRVDGGGTGMLLGTSGLVPSGDRGLDLGGGSNRWNQVICWSVVATSAFGIQSNWNLGGYGDGKLQFTAAGGDVTQRLTFGDINGGVALCRTSGQNGYFEIKSGDGTVFKGLRAQYTKTEPVTVASLPASPVEGMRVAVTDSTTTTFGATVTGGGSNHVEAYYNGSAWTVSAI